MKNRKKGLTRVLDQAIEESWLYLIFPLLTIALSLIRYCYNDPVNPYFFIFLLGLSSAFAYFAIEGAKIEREEKSNNKTK